MNEYQQKAEAYVRSQLPELMELSFGCEVRQVDTYTIIGGVNHSLHVRRHSDGKIYDSLMIGPNWTIIGHPIQLQHWLRVLSVVDPNVYENWLDKWDDKVFSWDFSNEDGMLSITFNLTTGQPATEEDYKAFCEIVGI